MKLKSILLFFGIFIAIPAAAEIFECSFISEGRGTASFKPNGASCSSDPEPIFSSKKKPFPKGEHCRSEKGTITDISSFMVDLDSGAASWKEKLKTVGGNTSGSVVNAVVSSYSKNKESVYYYLGERVDDGRLFDSWTINISQELDAGFLTYENYTLHIYGSSERATLVSWVSLSDTQTWAQIKFGKCRKSG